MIKQNAAGGTFTVAAGTKLLCDCCGAEFTAKSSRRRHSKHYCSKKCLHQNRGKLIASKFNKGKKEKTNFYYDHSILETIDY